MEGDDETFYVIEREHWVKRGNHEGLSIIDVVVSGPWNTGLLETLRAEECFVKERLERLHSAEKNGMLAESDPKFLDKPGYAVISTGVEISWGLPRFIHCEEYSYSIRFRSGFLAKPKAPIS
jgi:hypothetical protein